MSDTTPTNAGPDRRLAQKLTRGQAVFGLADKSSLAQIFHENTKLGPMTSRAYSASIINFSRSHSAQQTLEQAEKVYTLMERRELPRVAAQSELERTIAARRSVRKFSGEPLTLEELARLLHFTYGRTDALGRFRAVASGGALFPLELYVAALRIEGLEPGLYHYGSATSSLNVVAPGDPLPALKRVLAWEGVDIENAALALIVTAVFRRNTVKYADRGYRLILLEAGEAGQNLCLLAADMKLGACLLGGFLDDELSDVLGLDGVDEAPLLPVLLGRPAPPSASPASAAGPGAKKTAPAAPSAGGG
jgi:SagB-type dehydrogenase family enzyme